MAARLSPRHDDRSRSKIQTSQLINRLNLFALGAPDPCSIHGKPIEMTDTQVRAALGLLRKTLPDLAVTELRGDPDRPVSIEFTWAPAAATQAVSHETKDAPVIDATPEPSDNTEFVWGKSGDDTA